MQIVVLSAPYSGHAVLVRLLNLLGAYFGEEGIALDHAHPEGKGHWERKDVRRIHDNLLHAAGADRLCCDTFELDALPAEALALFAEKSAIVLRNLDAHRPWVLGDPALSLCWPLWESQLESPLLLHWVRHPLATAREGEARDDISLPLGVAQWEVYQRQALRQMAGRNGLRLDYADWVAKPVAFTQQLYKQLLNFGCTGLRLPSDSEILAFSAAFSADAEETEALGEYLNQAQLALWTQLRGADTPVAEDQPPLSAGARCQLRAYASDQKTQQHASNEAALKTAAQQAASALKAQQQSAAATIEEQQTRLEELQAVRAHLEQELSQSRAKLEQQQRSLERQRLAVQQKNAEAQRLARWLQQLQSDTQDLLHSRRWQLGDGLIRQIEKLLLRPRVPLVTDHMQEIFSDFAQWRRQEPRSNTIGAQQRDAGTLRLPAPPPRPRQSYKRTLPESEGHTLPGISIIVLNRDGAAFLRDLFESFLAHVRYQPVEFLIVDHASQDDSRALIASYQDRLPLQLFALEQNYSFAHSNNYAAKRARYDYLLFLNNDIIFTAEPLLEPLSAALLDPQIGLAGATLYYPPDHAEQPGRVQHAGIQFRRDDQYHFFRPYNLQQAWPKEAGQTLYFSPAVTAALVLCRKTEFLELGGFAEAYDYGYEDVDLCLSYRLQLGKHSALLSASTVQHNESASQKTERREALRERRLNNIAAFKQRYGYALKRAVREDQLSGRQFWSQEGLVVAFAVTEMNEKTGAGDYFTALELGAALQEEFAWEVRFLALKNNPEDPYCLTGVDVLIVMVDNYDVRQIYQNRPELLRVAWMRNWFEQWAERDWFDAFDVFLCSSRKAADFIRDEHGKAAQVLRIACNHKRFYPDPKVEKSVDYCFTGSYWNVRRDIQMLDPRKLDYSFAVYGQRWEKYGPFRPYCKGFLPYAELPAVYRSARLLLDDANHVTKQWGSVNSRVFDALACGTLVISNGEAGAEEVFAGKLPTYANREELEQQLHRYLQQADEREALSRELQQQVLQDHTYSHRAHELQQIVLNYRRERFRIALKIPVPKPEVAYEWGDYHFALALQRALVAQGHSVRIDLLPDWYGADSFGDDVALVLRGLSEYEPQPDQLNLMWNISHPDKVTDAEYAKYDHVFIASETYAEQLQQRLQTPISALLQCTDPALFYPDPAPEVPAHEVLFVGNSRKQYRAIVKHAIAAGLPLSLYGTRWEERVPAGYLRGEHIPNQALRQYYSRCGILLNDHWPSMREQGFISNRLFDAGACGALIITDAVAGLEQVFGDTVATYADTPEDLAATVRRLQENPEKQRAMRTQIQALVRKEHSFTRRAEQIMAVILDLDRERAFNPEFSV